MIDKLSLTTYIVPDLDYLESHGRVSVDEYNMKLYKYIYELKRMVIFCCPHKFSESINARIPFTKIDISTKNFVCFSELEAHLKTLFNDPELDFTNFNVSRIDIAADIDNITPEKLLSTMNVKHIRSESFNIHKGTIYAGVDPKIRIYNKVKEIRARIRKGKEITEYEKRLLDSGKEWTRFEIQIRSVKKNLKEIVDDPLSLASYFDRLEFIKTNRDETNGILQFIYRFINRKFRKEIEELRDKDLIERIKDTYRRNVTDWFTKKEPF